MRAGAAGAALLAIVGIGVLGYWYTRSSVPRETGRAEAPSIAERDADAHHPAREEHAAAANPASDAERASLTAVPGEADDVARWIADTTSGDAQKRAAAITALSGAPRSRALPVLRNVLLSGEPEVDRPLALRALRDLALHQGDADGAVRAAVREAIYHGDNETVAGAAQEVLDVVEESEMQ
jgi:hypothetical protein